jgi:hypothetical protein
MSTTFGYSIPRPDGTLCEPIIIARRCNGIRWVSDIHHLLDDRTPIDALDNTPQGIHTIGDIRKRLKYPFVEGEDYYTVENGDIIYSCWDFVSEELHDANPDKRYWYVNDDYQLIEKK